MRRAIQGVRNVNGLNEQSCTDKIAEKMKAAQNETEKGSGRGHSKAFGPAGRPSGVYPIKSADLKRVLHL